LSVLANCEYPNGLALSPDERTMYVANTRSSQYIHAIRFDAAGNMVERSVFADLNEAASRASPTDSRSTASAGFIALDQAVFG
jgi:gluconolactonase